MQRKFKILLTIIILGCNILGLSDGILEKRMISKVPGYCTLAEAANIVDVENKENKETDDIEKEAVEEASEKDEVSKNAINEETEQEKFIISRTKEEAEILNDIERDETRKQEEKEKVEDEIIQEVQMDDCIYNVSFPTNPRAYLDPGNLSGRGQVFSNDFMVENYGNTDIAVKIKNIEVYYHSTESVFELSKEDITDAASYVKKINVDIIWKNEKENAERVLDVVEGYTEEYVLFLKASEYDNDGQFVRLNDGSTGLFYFTGTLSSNPELIWEDGEVTVSFDYEIVHLENEETEILNEQDESMPKEDWEIQKEEEYLKLQEELKMQEGKYELELQENQKAEEEIDELKLQENQKKQEESGLQENQKKEELEAQEDQEKQEEPGMQENQERKKELETQENIKVPIDLEADK